MALHQAPWLDVTPRKHPAALFLIWIAPLGNAASRAGFSLASKDLPHSSLLLSYRPCPAPEEAKLLLSMLAADAWCFSNLGLSEHRNSVLQRLEMHTGQTLHSQPEEIEAWNSELYKA